MNSLNFMQSYVINFKAPSNRCCKKVMIAKIN